MSHAVWTQKVMCGSGQRTPYYEACARVSAYHEAGHVVVGHLLGLKIKRVLLRQAQFEPFTAEDPFLGRTPKEKARRIEVCRDLIAVFSAGFVASTIHQQEVQDQGFANAQERLAYERRTAIRASLQIKHNFEQIDDPANDCYVIAREVGKICFAWVRAQASPMSHDKGVLGKALQKSLVKRRDAEVLQAEDRAERLLKKHWPAVSEVATALCRSKTGTLTGKRVLTILERHIG